MKSFVGRRFQFWQYRVSHGELLVRSPKDLTHPRNIDIMFVGVDYLDLPRYIENLVVDEPNDEDMTRAQERLGKPVDRRNVVVLKSQGRNFIVVAATVRIEETTMDIFESPFQ